MSLKYIMSNLDEFDYNELHNFVVNEKLCFKEWCKNCDEESEPDEEIDKILQLIEDIQMKINATPKSTLKLEKDENENVVNV